MILVVAMLLLLPVSAACGALVVGVMHRDEALEDGPLVRHFVFMVAMFVVAFVGISRIDPVRRAIDPVWRITQEIRRHPLPSTVLKLSRDRGQRIQVRLAARMATGASIDDALSLERPMLYAEAADVLGFADQKTHVQWAHAVRDMLAELRTVDPSACFHLRLGVQPPAQRSGAGDGAPGRGSTVTAATPHRYAARNDAAFNAAFIAVMETAWKGMEHSYVPRDPPVDGAAATLAWREVDEAVAMEFDDGVARAVRTHDVSALAPADIDDDTLCAARIFQLDEMLKRPVGIASRLTDSVLR